MSREKKYKVTLSGGGFSYTVIVMVGENATMREFKELAVKKIKDQYKADVPEGVPVDLEFEIVG